MKKILLIIFFLLMPLTAHGLTNVTSYGCTYGSGDNTTCAQTALDAGVPLEISAYLPMAGAITINNAGTSIEGSGSWNPTSITINNLNYWTGVNYTRAAGVIFMVNAPNAVFSYFTLTSGSFWFYNSSTTSGSVLDHITFGPAGIVGELNGVEIKNSTFVGTNTGEPSGATMEIAGSDNLFHNNTFTLNDNRNAIRFLPLTFSSTYRASSKDNKIYNNTISGGVEDRIVWDDIIGVYRTGYITDITGTTITLNLKVTTGYLGNPASFAGTDMVVVAGGHPGVNYEIASKTDATHWVVTETPTNLTVGDFVVIASIFADNEIYSNTITSATSGGTNAINGTGITLFGGVVNNYVHDNSITVEGKEYFTCGPEMQWNCPLAGVIVAGLLTFNDTDFTGYACNEHGTMAETNAFYMVNDRNRVEYNNFYGALHPIQNYALINFSSNQDNSFGFGILQAPVNAMYSWNNAIVGNTSDLPIGATTQLTYLRDAQYSGNTLPSIAPWGDSSGCYSVGDGDNTFLPWVSLSGISATGSVGSLTVTVGKTLFDRNGNPVTLYDRNGNIVTLQ
jgi:hypothetical protein